MIKIVYNRKKRKQVVVNLLNELPDLKYAKIMIWYNRSFRLGIF